MSQAPLQIRTIVGRNIASARDSHQMTQRALAIKLRVDTRAISRWETGRVLPSATNLQALAALLDRDAGWFYTDHSSERGVAA